MRVSPALTLGLALALSVRLAGAQSTSQTATEAHPAWTYSVASKCPELHAADDGPAAVVVFRVSDFGAPSQISVQTSSGSAALDEAAVKCVQKLKFQPRTRLGDGPGGFLAEDRLALATPASRRAGCGSRSPHRRPGGRRGERGVLTRRRHRPARVRG